MDPTSNIRPPTPQALLHRAPNKPSLADAPVTRPSKYIILLLAPTSVAGKVQIATSIAKELSCPLFQGDSLHESSAKAAAVGASRSDDGGRGRYQRMWLSKMTRTGLLFPEESRPANEGFAGFGSGGAGSAETSRRGSMESSSSLASVDVGDQGVTSSGVFGTGRYVNKPVFNISEEERRQKVNPALMVLTHPALEPWHKDAIREAVGEYGIGVIFVPLFQIDVEHGDVNEAEKEEQEVPVLRLLDPKTVSAFTSFDALRAAGGGGGGGMKLEYGKGKAGDLEEEMLLEVDVGGGVEEIIEEVVKGVKDVMFA